MKKLILAAFFLLTASAAFAESFIELRVPCRVGSQVTATLPGGEVVELGRVKIIPAKTNWPAYTASKWATPSTVCATAVNAVHILVRVDGGRGRIISLVPPVTEAPAAVQSAFFSLDMPAGTGVFGAFAPLTGSEVRVEHDGKESKLMGVPNEGDTLVIRSKLPESPAVYMADIENRPGGRIIAHTAQGSRVIARVIRPVKGVGRFGGSMFQTRGRIRASHSGVICVATAPRDVVGGFQVMPLKHALTSPEMLNAWKLTQWLIVAPLFGRPDLEGSEPLFKSSFVPGPQLGDRLPDFWSYYGRKPLILCRRDGGNWEKLPEVSGKVDDGLRDITHLRFYFPVWLREKPQL
ncbi:MAG: hypothetical protein IJR98_03445 [Synergistaceae bacterium]|nr:hypothetical protein [Synergistaceae bacterium]